MKVKLLKIAHDLDDNIITEHEARNLLINLLGLTSKQINKKSLDYSKEIFEKNKLDYSVDDFAFDGVGRIYKKHITHFLNNLK